MEGLAMARLGGAAAHSDDMVIHASVAFVCDVCDAGL